MVNNLAETCNVNECVEKLTGVTQCQGITATKVATLPGLFRRNVLPIKCQHERHQNMTREDRR